MSNAETGEPQVGTIYELGGNRYKLVSFSPSGTPCYVRWIKKTSKWSGQAYQGFAGSSGYSYHDAVIVGFER